MTSDIALAVRFPVDDEALWCLHQSAFGSPAGARRSWAHQLERHSLTWVGAFAEEDLVGFVNVCWDRAFYRNSCGFVGTHVGLLRLAPTEPS